MEGVDEAPCARSTRARASAPYKWPLLADAILGTSTSNRTQPFWRPLIGRGRSFSSSWGGGVAYLCAGNWIQRLIRLLNHGAQAQTPAYLWVIGMAVCGDKDMATLTRIWCENSARIWLFHFAFHCVHFSRLVFNILQISTYLIFQKNPFLT